MIGYVSTVMAKFTNPSKLSDQEREELLIFLCGAICNIKNTIEAAKFLGDLLSPQEAEMIAKRLKIAQMLIGGKKYSEISYCLKVGDSTISRVYEWLKISGEGLRTVISRQNEKDDFDDNEDFSITDLKKRYPLYYWPQVLLESIVSSASRREKRKLQIALKSMDKKTLLYKKLSKILA